MVQLALPESSRIRPGKTWPKPAIAKRATEFRICPWKPDGGPISSGVVAPVCKWAVPA